MKVHKIKKKWYSDLSQMLKDVGAVEGLMGYPGFVYWSAKDEEKSKKAIRKAFKDKYGYMSDRSLDSGVGMEYLQYGPNSALEDVLKPGYLVVDTRAIKEGD